MNKFVHIYWHYYRHTAPKTSAAKLVGTYAFLRHMPNLGF
jgi:hypothetical protein